MVELCRVAVRERDPRATGRRRTVQPYGHLRPLADHNLAGAYPDSRKDGGVSLQEESPVRPKRIHSVAITTGDGAEHRHVGSWIKRSAQCGDDHAKPNSDIPRRRDRTA